ILRRRIEIQWLQRTAQHQDGGAQIIEQQRVEASGIHRVCPGGAWEIGALFWCTPRYCRSGRSWLAAGWAAHHWASDVDGDGIGLGHDMAIAVEHHGAEKMHAAFEILHRLESILGW